MDNAARDKEGVKGASDFIEKLLKAKDVTSLMVMAVRSATALATFICIPSFYARRCHEQYATVHTR
jgi:hypothetical protein